MIHSVGLFLVLAAFWLLNSGHYTPLLLSLGVASIVLTLLLARRMDVVDHEAQPLHLSIRMPGYFLWLFKEIMLSNIAVVKCIWGPRSAISPALFTLKASQQTDVGKVIYANSITLTPGTVTMNLTDSELTVHALTRQVAADLRQGTMDQKVSRLER